MRTAWLTAAMGMACGVALGQGTLPTEEGIDDAAAVIRTGEAQLIGSSHWQGDVLGYSAGGVGDVNGDGFRDYAMSFYFRAIDFDENTTFETDEDLAGLVTVCSGKDDTQIGVDIEAGGSSWRLSHDITHLADITGDGRTELVLSAPGVGDGTVWIYAFTDAFNQDVNDTTERWVAVYKIEGTSTHFYGGGDNGFGDFVRHAHYHDSGVMRDLNEDGVDDLIVLDTSWDEASGVDDDDGAASVFLFPWPFFDINSTPLDPDDDVNIYEEMADQWRDDNCGACTSGTVGCFPIEVSQEDCDLLITGQGDAFPRLGNRIVDINGDDMPELGLGAKYEDYDYSCEYEATCDGTASDSDEQGVGAVYVYLSTSEVRDGDSEADEWTDLTPNISYDDANRVMLTGSGTVTLGLEDADVHIIGPQYWQHEDDTGTGWNVGGFGTNVIGEDFDGDGYIDLASSGDADSGSGQDNRVYMYFLEARLRDGSGDFEYPAADMSGVTTEIWTDNPSANSMATHYGFDQEDDGGPNGTFWFSKNIMSHEGQFEWVNGAKLAGDVDGDGDMELMLQGARRGGGMMVQVWNFGEDSDEPTYEVLRTFRPESGITCTAPATTSGFTAGSTHTASLWSSWDVDNDERDDLMMAARRFPTAITDTINQKDCAPSGRLYLVLSPHDPSYSSHTPSEVETGQFFQLQITGTDMIWKRGQSGFKNTDVSLTNGTDTIYANGPPTTEDSSSGDGVTPTKITASMVFPCGSTEGDYDLVVEWRDDNSLQEVDAVSVTEGTICSLSVIADFDGDGSVGTSDLISLLDRWGDTDTIEGDLNGDGVVNDEDLELMIQAMDR